ncbi:pilus assembly protein [Bacterioplanoides pacificum]|uniref:Pilus assembly protein n=1 Tax=Bacterioplanoides pacificum TaxID=1171596 RepID=A0ABV7VUK3_9GAMM
MKLYWLSIIAFGLLSARLAYADDTEIYRNTKTRINPNVIFLIDTSGSMTWSAGDKSRIEVVKSAANAAINNLKVSEPINIAIMRFDDRYRTYQGGYVIEHFTPTDSASNKQQLIDTISSLSYSNIGGGTPLTESFYEAARYMRGDSTYYGTPDSDRYRSVINGGNSYTYKRNYGSVAESVYTNNSRYYYRTPVTATCQKNHIVLFTDGDPSSDNSANYRIQNLVDNMTLPNALDDDCSGDGGCADELAYWLQNTDHFQDSSLTGQSDPNASETDQKIFVHTVGGFSGISQSGEQLLNNIAKYGHPLTKDHLNDDGSSKHYYAASDEASLTTALNNVFGGISNSAGNFAAPVVAVNAFNSLEHREELYYSVFQPAELPGWSGNIKRYKMSSSGQILDADDQLAINPDTGFFKDSAKSVWTQGSADGAVVTKGGIANRLPANRKIYTRLLGTGNIISVTNAVNENNTALTSALLETKLPVGSSLSSSERNNVLKWARGLDPESDTARKSMADPLHGNPVMVSYRDSSNNISDILFSGTNVGYIHAIDPQETNPEELWAYIPKELLGNLAAYQQGRSRLQKVYGIDGPMSLYHQDNNQDRIVDTGDKAYLIAGMRRGGSSYYFLDVSSKKSPSLKAQINAGDSGFEELGQTWSKMIPARVSWNGKVTDVFFFGGGYDVDEDSAKTRQVHDQGNAIYMISAPTATKGPELLWKATGASSNSKGKTYSEMDSSFAADLTLIDNDGNGTVDLLYAADIGGRLWRFDIDKANTGANSFADGGVIADFNDGSETGNRRFFTQPDVVYTEYGFFKTTDPSDSTKTVTTKKGRYQISIGSGFRADPLNKVVQNKIFIINDFDIDGAPGSGYTKLGLSDLANLSNYSNSSYAQQKNGAYYSLSRAGEKVLSSTLTVNDVIYVPTFRPSDSNVNVGCEPDSGQASLIKIQPVNDPDDTERQVDTIALKQGGIVPEPVLVFPPKDKSGSSTASGAPVIAIGTEIEDITGDFNAFQKTYWKEN